jgi:hypothetical protein
MNPDELSFARLSISEPQAGPAGSRLDESYNLRLCLSQEFLQDLSQKQLSIRSAEEEHEDLSDDGAWRLTFRAHFERNMQNLNRFLHPSSDVAGPTKCWLVEELSCESICQIAGVQNSGSGRRFVTSKPCIASPVTGPESCNISQTDPRRDVGWVRGCNEGERLGAHDGRSARKQASLVGVRV